MQATLPRHDIVLLGAGHTNSHVLRMWRMRPLADARLTCVSNFSTATYSGMLPGTLAGLYPRERMEIDLVRLCTAVGARLVVGEVCGLDVERQELHFEDRSPLRFDALSIGIGSVPDRSGLEIDDGALLAIKPMQTFVARLEARLRAVAPRLGDRPLRLAVVGGGVGGVEIALCLPARVRRCLGEVACEMALVSSDVAPGTGLPAAAAERVARELARRGVRLHLGQRARRVTPAGVELADGAQVAADIVLWATGARPPQLLARLGLPTDEAGFLRTDASLRSVNGAPIFAVGDSGTIEGTRLPKAGVYAVRQGPVLWANLDRTLRGQPLQQFKPQRGFLKLLCTGDGRAILSYKALAFHAGWCWRLKDWIDGRFMDKHQDYEPMPMAPAEADGAAAMRCAGCGGKVGGSVLSATLARLEIPPAEHVLLGLDRPDDAAIVAPPGGGPVTITTDFFAAPLDDPYTVGRLAALNAASDVFALGGRPHSALAIATLPVGPRRQQEQMLFELLSGALRELRAMGATLVGGHTIEGPQVLLGFTLLAEGGGGGPRTKDGLRPGDHLLLTKPLGSGALLAAAMRARCRAAWMDPLRATMLASNQPLVELLDPLDISGVTDVTGFGLAGHLLEMLRASRLGAELELDELPLLPGVAELIAAGIESTLAPENRTVETDIACGEAARRRPAYAALFDPQTSGGLLLGVASPNLSRAEETIEQATGTRPAIIGRALPHQSGTARLRVG